MKENKTSSNPAYTTYFDSKVHIGPDSPPVVREKSTEPRELWETEYGMLYVEDKLYRAEIPSLGIMTQGKTLEEIYNMILDAVQLNISYHLNINKEDYKIEVEVPSAPLLFFLSQYKEYQADIDIHCISKNGDIFKQLQKTFKKKDLKYDYTS